METGLTDDKIPHLLQRWGISFLLLMRKPIAQAVPIHKYSAYVAKGFIAIHYAI